jgi:hypothetical protein
MYNQNINAREINPLNQPDNSKIMECENNKKWKKTTIFFTMGTTVVYLKTN